LGSRPASACHLGGQPLGTPAARLRLGQGPLALKIDRCIIFCAGKFPNHRHQKMSVVFCVKNSCAYSKKMK
jgi:hypothetical protein